MIEKIVHFLIPGLARRERIIGKLVERNHATRVYRDDCQTKLRSGTTRLLKTLCRERETYIADGRPGIVIIPKL